MRNSKTILVSCIIYRINLLQEKCAYNLRGYSLGHLYNLKPIMLKEYMRL